MPKVRTTLTIDEEVLRAVKVLMARTGRGDSEVIEEAVRKALAETTRSILVTSDHDQLSLVDSFPVWTARALAEVLAAE